MKKPKQNYFAGQRSTKEKLRSNGRKYTIRANRNRFFFPDEWMVFYDNLKPKQKITFHILINTGARIMEAQHIQVKDIDLERNIIILTKTKRRLKKIGGKETESKIRPLTISTQFTKYLKKIIKKNNLNPTDKLPILSTPAANIGMKKALIKAGIKDYDMFSVHNVRKTLESWLSALEIPINKLTKHFGHSLVIADKHYVSPDIFSFEDKQMMRQIIGDLFQG